jgi:hypothetical protein
VAALCASPLSTRVIFVVLNEELIGFSDLFKSLFVSTYIGV